MIDSKSTSGCGLSRRDFLRHAGTLSAAAGIGLAGCRSETEETPTMQALAEIGRITIRAVDSNFEREPLIRPFGFKGGYMSEIWQSIARLESDTGLHGIGLCSQSVLWSDASVFANHSESGGNALMYAISERALRMVNGESFTSPIELVENLFEELLRYGKEITGNPNLRETFILNSLVGLDNAAWILYARHHGITRFDDLIPPRYAGGLSWKHEHLASIPLMAYTIPIEEIVEAVDQGYFFLKIKIGQPGTQEEMLEKDMARLSAIHNAVGHRETPHTADGKLPYYFDANGRYETKELFQRLLDHAKGIGAFEQIAVVEEPFPEHADIEVGDMGVTIAADESAHTDRDVAKRIEMGYGAVALKAIAKTLSMTMKMAQIASENDVPCFCADLTVNPILIDWNKNVSARLAPFPGFSVGLLETNGHQNYRNWDLMRSYHPNGEAPWTQVSNGLFTCGPAFYDRCGGILDPSEHYEAMFRR
jgi:L-alanine-DL-glutamate epimerase-like enolase superfamily enzyme